MTRRLLVLLLLALATAGCRDMGPGGTGKVSEVVYRVTGQGSADVQYAATGGADLTARPGVALPFQQEVHVVDRSGIVYRVRVTTAAGADCSIEVNGVGVDVQKQRSGRTLECSFIK